MEEVNIVELIMYFATALIIGGVVYSLYISMAGIGGVIGRALKIIGVGIILLSLYALDSVFNNLIDFSFIRMTDNVLANNILDHAFLQISLLFLAWGLITLTRMVKSFKK